MNALIAVIFVLLGTGMGQDVGGVLWGVLASVEWSAISRLSLVEILLPSGDPCSRAGLLGFQMPH